jgi:hypothetical protein
MSIINDKDLTPEQREFAIKTLDDKAAPRVALFAMSLAVEIACGALFWGTAMGVHRAGMMSAELFLTILLFSWETVQLAMVLFITFIAVAGYCIADNDDSEQYEDLFENLAIPITPFSLRLFAWIGIGAIVSGMVAAGHPILASSWLMIDLSSWGMLSIYNAITKAVLQKAIPKAKVPA